MESNNWSFPSLNRINTGQTNCGDGSDFYGWHDGTSDGVMEYTFSGSGTFDIEFGNCGTSGQVYLLYEVSEEAANTVTALGNIFKMEFIFLPSPYPIIVNSH